MNYLRKTKGFFAAMISIIMMLSMLIPFAGISAFASSNNVDVVLVIDDTESMQTNDTDFLAGEAVRKFADLMMSDSDNVNIRFGIATYCFEIMEGALALGQDGDAIKAFSESNITQSGNNTDAAAGVKWAVEQLKNGSDANTKKAVILVGDGANDFRGITRTADDSEADLQAAIEDAKNNEIAVYTLAINPQADEFRQYFERIADETDGKSYLPQSADDIDTYMREICDELRGGIKDEGEIETEPNVPVTIDIEVPDGVFEMNLQCDHAKPVDIYFTDPDSGVHNESSGDVLYYEEDSYSNFKIQEPIAGDWTVTVTSDIAQNVQYHFVMHTDLTVSLSKNQDDIMQKQEVEYIATVASNGNEIVDDTGLTGLEANLVITQVDKAGNKGNSKSEPMAIRNGKFVLSYAVDKAGKYEIYAELVGDKSTIKSNTLTIDAAKDPSIIPLWIILLIVLAILILIAVLLLIIIKMRNKEGGDYVRGNVSMKIVGRTSNDDTMIFENNRFNCETVFEKKNTLSDLVSAYVKWYRAINTSELSELSLSQYINSALTEVTDKITICGNKKKQTIIRIPAGFDMQVDGMDILKPKKIAFSSPEKSIDLKFKNQGCTYSINLMFTKNVL